MAIVSLVEDDRQVFAAQDGLPEPWATRGETPLTHSFCQHVVQRKAPFVVPDSLEEPLVEGNLAITELDVRAYLGVPLPLPSGEVIGALAAIADAPRAWTTDDLAILRAIAGIVGKGFEASLEEQKWRSLFAGMQEGFILGEVVRNEAGTATDWRYLEVNRAWGELIGISSETVIGRTVREVIPGVEGEWVQEFAQVVETGEPISFTRRVGDLQRWYDGFAQPVGGDRFVVLFIEVTDRVLTTARREALAELGDRLREAGSIEEAAFIGAEVMGRTLHASRAGFGLVDVAAETVHVQPDWCAPGMDSIAGPHSFRDYGTYIEDLKRGETVIVPDVVTDPRTAAFAATLEALAIRQLVNVPVLVRGRLAAVMLVHHSELRELSRAEVQFIRAIADRTQAAVAQMQAEEDQAVLNREISHRMKNTLAMVQAIAAQTLRSVPDKEPVKALEQRLFALSNAHDLLLSEKAKGATIEAVIRSTLAGLGQEGRVKLSGPQVSLGSRSALSFALVVHELATNALKHGALSAEGGHVEIEWKVADAALSLRWQEIGGPPAEAPTRRGMGSRLIAGGLTGAGDVELNYDASGFTAVMQASLEQLGV